MTRQADDAEAVRRCLAGDVRAYRELIDRYKNQIFTFVLRMVSNSADAEDLAQEAFLKAFKNLASFDPQRSFISWLFRIAHNATLDFLRAKSPEAISIHDEDSPVEIADASQSVEETLHAGARRELVDGLLQSLPPLYREALLLRHHEDLDVKEVAEILQIPEGTAKIRLFRARDMLRKKLEESGFEA